MKIPTTKVPLLVNSKCPALMHAVKQIKGFFYIPDFGVKMCNAHALALALKYKGALARALSEINALAFKICG